MTPPIWSDVSADLEIALTEARRAEAKATNLASLSVEARENAEMAIGKHLHDAYCAAETAIERLLLTVDGDVPRGRDYHRDVLRRAARPTEGLRPPIIRHETWALLGDLLKFRHAYRHAYGAFAWDRAEPNVALAARAIPLLVEDLTAFAKPRG
ncbi:hypothetical protein ACE7GA_13510 [Roseomonas sp. CCTCC AB2023176]|uniref:ribonuclease toxin HepT-like protein n=1 Tax=Roseomonas sp. CCTCC AB2023176 TaxID=3342640 RepID=UPI0035D6C0C0